MTTRRLDAYCPVCEEPRVHILHEDDPGSCVCSVCGNVQQTYEPVRI